MRIKALSLLFILFIGILSLCAFYGFYYFPHAPLSNNLKVIIFEIPAGSSIKYISNQLVSAGLLPPSKAPLFCLLVQFKGVEKSFKAGEYAIAMDNSPEQLIKKFIKGEVIQYALTIPEGATIKEVVNLMHAHPKIKKTVINQPLELVKALHVPYLSAEGLLYPDTYYFIAHTTELAILKRAYEKMQIELQKAWRNKAEDTVLNNPYEALILASIIEKEAAVVQERYIISGVFQRRISKNMRLQADPTVVYGLGEEFPGILTRALLKKHTDFNTYLNTGLPPTPISLPSLSALQAALHPMPDGTLYFVAKGDGTHYFSATLEEHNQAVRKYRRGEHEH